MDKKSTVFSEDYLTRMQEYFAAQQAVSCECEHVFASTIYRVPAGWVTDAFRGYDDQHTVRSAWELEEALMANRHTTIFIPAEAAMTFAHLRLALEYHASPKTVIWEQ